MTTTGPQASWFGHPRGLAVLFVAELWERTSYYGMRALLVLYMVDHLFKRPDVSRAVWGHDALQRALTAAFGPLQPQALASQVYGLYTGFVYLTPLFGGLLADRLLGRRRSVVAGGVLMAIGHFLMASEQLFFIALLVLIVGNGCFKPNVSTQVGGLYEQGDPRRDRAYSVFYLGINIGAFIAPLVCGTLGQTVGWHYGFGAAGVGMVLGLMFYMWNQNKLPQEPLPTASPTAPLLGLAGYVVGVPLLVLALLALLALPVAVQAVLAALAFGAVLRWLLRLPGDERPRVIALCVACLVTATFWAVYEQQGNTLQLWADQTTAWPTIAGFTIPSTWYQSFNPFMIFFFVPLLNAFWAWQARRHSEPSSVMKLAMGCALEGFGFIVMMAAQLGAEEGQRQSVWWLVGATAIFTVGELYLSPIGLSFVTKVAPARLVSTMMGVWFFANFIGNTMAGWLGSFYEVMPRTRFFSLMLVIGVAGGAVLWVTNRRLNRVMVPHSPAPAVLSSP